MNKKEMVNFYEQVDRNKSRSFVVMVLFVLFVSGVVWLLGNVFGTDPSVVVLAVVFSLFSALTSYFYGDKIVLSISGAKEANRKEHYVFYTAAENLSLAAQIPMPKLYVINSAAMNAFATGRDPKHAVVCVTTGLMEKLDKTEMEGVIAHEIAHIIGYDIRLMTIVAILVGMVTLLTDWILRSMLFSGGDSKRKAHPILLVVGIISLILSPIIAKLMQLALSRSREHLADSMAVKLTRQPSGLIGALKKISNDSNVLKQANAATAHLYIANPFKKENKVGKNIANLFSTHPPVEERIANLEKMF